MKPTGLLDPKATHIMVDIETLDTAETAAITEVCCMPFSLTKYFAPTSVLNELINVEAQFRTTSEETLAWLVTNGNPPKHGKAALSPRMAAIAINSVLADYDYVWANSPSFDLRILRHFVTCHELTPSWDFRKEVDMRFPIELVGVHEYPVSYQGRELLKHVAADDCTSQILRVRQAIKIITSASA